MSVLNYRVGQRGIGLIEVLAALFVISVGLLGVAKMGAVALADTGISARQSIAALQASSMAAAMHANQAYWAKGGVAPASVLISGSTVTNTAFSSTPAICNTVTACLPLQMAAYDTNQWAIQLQGVAANGVQGLPNDQAKIECSQNTSVPVTCTIQISWDENAVSLHNNASLSATRDTHTYTLYVEP